MKLKLITAKSNNYALKKSIEILSEEAKNLEKNFLVVVPEKFSLSIERLLLLNSKSKAITNVQVVTLSRLLKKMVTSENNYLSGQAGIMVVKKIILDNLEKLVCFKKTAKTMGFAAQIYDTISQLKNSNISPDDYDKMAEGVGSALKIKLQDIFLLYKEYENFINNKYIDASDRFVLLSKLVEENKNIIDNEVWMLGFESMTESGYMVIDSFLRQAKSLTIACSNFENYNNSYIYSSEMYEGVKYLAHTNQIKPTHIHFAEERSFIAKHLSENLFSYPYKSTQNNGEIKLFEHSTIREEIECVAEQIRSLAISGNRYKNIAVACPDFTAYSDIIRSVFYDYEIPYFIDTSDNLSNHPLAIFLISALSVVRKNYAGEEVVLFAKNIFSGIDTDRLSTFENYIIKYGITYDSFKSPFHFGKNKNKDELKAAESVRQELIEKLSRFEKTINGKSNISDYYKAIKLFFEDFSVKQMSEDFAKQQTNMHDEVSASATMQAEEKIFNLLEETKSILDNVNFSVEEFQSILSSGLNATKLSFIPETIDSVFVGDVSTSKFFEVDYLFVIGAVEGELPYTKDDCGIIVDSELEVMSKTVAKKIEPSIRTINKREKYKVFELLQIPNEQLIVSYPNFAADSEETKPSIVVRDLQKIYTDENKKNITTTKQVDRILKRAEMTEQELAEDFASEFCTRKVGEKKLFSAFRDFRNNVLPESNQALPSLYVAVKKRMDKKTQNIFDNMYKSHNKFSLKNARKLFFPKNTTSISELENYFSCPYKHYVDYGLKVRAREDAKLKAVDVGNIMHKIAEYFVKDIVLIVKMEKNRQKTAIVQIFDRALKDNDVSSASNQYIVKLLKSEAERMCQALMYQFSNSEFKPSERELFFGANSFVPAINLDNKISIEGKIDRVDTTADEFRVIDYKTGAFDLAASEVYYGKKIQLFIYLKALDKYKNLKHAGAFYLPIKNVFTDERKESEYLSTYRMEGYFVDNVNTVLKMDKTLSLENPNSKIISASLSTAKENISSGTIKLQNKNHIMPAKLLGEISNYVTEISKIAVQEIMDGYINPSPLQKSERATCKYCDYKYICGFPSSETDTPRKIERDIKFEKFISEDR